MVNGVLDGRTKKVTLYISDETNRGWERVLSLEYPEKIKEMTGVDDVMNIDKNYVRYKNYNNVVGVNIWYFRDGFIWSQYSDENIVEDVEFFEISVQWESSKFYSFGIQLESGILINSTNNSYLSLMDGFFFKGKINVLSFGSNY